MSELHVIDSYRKVEAVMFSLEAFHDSRFQVIWKKVVDGIIDLDIRDPELS